jgi:HEPN domain-containing protein
LEEIEKELATAEAALREANEGKARVCARRAVALAAEASLERVPRPGWRGDAMHQLRQIQQEASFPLPIRQAAERLSTKITQRDTAPFTSNPIADAKLIIVYLLSAEPERK